jgi:hypothetical protein
MDGLPCAASDDKNAREEIRPGKFRSRAIIDDRL